MRDVEIVGECETSGTLVISMLWPGRICECITAESASGFPQAVSPLPRPIVTCLIQTLGGFRFLCCMPSGFQMPEDAIHFLHHEYCL